MKPEKPKTVPVNPSQKPVAKKKKTAEGVTSGTGSSTGGSREGNAGHVSEQYGSQGNR